MAGKKFTGDITEYREEYLDCRENHLWKWVTDWKLTRKGSKILEFTRTKQCLRCGVEAHRRYDGQTGRVISGTYYVYPDGYLTSDKNRLDAGQARLEMLRRAGYLKRPKGQNSEG